MDYNPFLPEVMENPYPYYAQLRQHTPVYHIEPLGWHVLSRYDDVAYALKNHQLFSSAMLFASTSLGDLNPVPEAANIISCDPPIHTRLRALVNKAFTPRIVADLEARIREITNHLLNQVGPNGEFDIMKGLAVPLPILVIAELLGVEPERRDDFKRWSDSFAGGLGGTANEDPQARQNIAEFRAYFQHMIEIRRKEPKNDLISGLLRAQEAGQTLKTEEILGLSTFLLIAGNETTTNLIGNTALALLRNPDQAEKVRTNPALLPNLVEEGLRYDPPVQMSLRRATQDVEIAGTIIPANTTVPVLFASGNRDGQKFAEPDRFDVTRQNAQLHLGFSFGIHFCVGAGLARLEAKIAFEELLARFPGLTWQEDHIKRNFALFIVRGLETLPVRFGIH